MNPKEKAKELVSKFEDAEFNCKDCVMMYCDVRCTILSNKEAVICALIAVDEIFQAIDWHKFETPNIEIDFWQEVKNELLKMKL
jgi:hypothetical protein